jgi:uncharacterized protein YbjT (DUF2867 family)
MGLVGQAVLSRLLDDNGYTAVHAVGRRATVASHPKLTAHVVASFDAALPRCDDLFIALGTTIKTAGSQQAFRAVDFDAVLTVARAARDAGCTRLGVVSAMGADSASSVFYNRVKGEMESAVASLGFDTLVIARPSLLAGNRASLGQPARLGEKLALQAARWINPLLPVDYRSIDADEVAGALIYAVKTMAPGTHRLLSGELQKIASEPIL